MATHCNPTPPGTDQVPVLGVNDARTSTNDPGPGNRRGIVVFFHPSTASDIPQPYAIPNGFGETILPLSNSLVANGWIFTYPNYPGDVSTYSTEYINNLINDCANDPGNGARLAKTMGLWADHWFQRQAIKYGPNRPTVLMGFSEGSWVALSLVTRGSPTGMSWPIVGYGVHCPPTIWSNIFAGFGNSTGMDISTTALNTVTIPGIVGISDNDSNVGWALSSQSPVLGMSYKGPPESNAYLAASNAITAGQPVTIYPTATSTPGASPVAYPNGHLFVSAGSPSPASLDAAHYASWITANIDPLAPPNTF